MDGNRFPKQVMKWITTGKRKRKRPKTTWEIEVRKTINKSNLAEE